MKTYEQRCAEVTEKISKLKERKRKRKIAVSSACLCLSLVLVLVLFWPLDTGAPSVSRYSDSPYYSLIQRINEATHQKPVYANNFERLLSLVDSLAKKGDILYAPTSGATIDDSLTNGSYVEVTDNQVAGVTEADIVKRSDKYIFQLRHNELRIYDIAKEETKQVASFSLKTREEAMWSDDLEMYLSQDCRTVYVLQLTGTIAGDRPGTYLSVMALDVSDVNNIKIKEQVFMSGNYLSSRMVGNDLLLMGEYYIPWDWDKDFSEESAYLPMVGPWGQMQPVAADSIYAPEELTKTRYTLVCKLDGQTLAVEDSAAFLSYSQELYVSAETIYATMGYTERTDSGSRAMTQITALGYAGQKLEHKGSVSVAGTVKNQYSMDEYEGVLRVVTSTTRTTSDNGWETYRNVDLTCIDLQTMQIVAQVEAFAPDGETAESVRFDGSKAYVCTAEVITLTDPVYFFDLSDLENITWKDTGTIDGYSSSLVNFRDGFALGIGYNAQRDLKIEVYEQTEDGVVSVCSYERSAAFSEEYKSYLIDRENGLIGLTVSDYHSAEDQYILLAFDGYELRLLAQVPILAGRLESVRAVIIDGWLYILAEELYLYRVW